MNKELEALRSIGALLGDLEIDKDTMLPKFVLSGNRAVNYKIVKNALIEKVNLEECLKGIEDYIDLRLKVEVNKDAKIAFQEIKNQLGIIKSICLKNEVVKDERH